MASKEEQIREVVEGLGLGLVALGVTSVSSAKPDLEFAFSYAWRQWQHSDEYPSIGRAPKPDNEFWIGVMRSERRRSATVVWRRDAAAYAVGIQHEGWSPEEAADLVGKRSLAEWVALAAPFRERLQGTV